MRGGVGAGAHSANCAGFRVEENARVVNWGLGGIGGGGEGED